MSLYSSLIQMKMTQILTNLTTESTFSQNCYNPFIPFVLYITCYVEQVFLFKIYFLLGV